MQIQLFQEKEPYNRAITFIENQTNPTPFRAGTPQSLIRSIPFLQIKKTILSDSEDKGLA